MPFGSGKLLSSVKVPGTVVSWIVDVDENSSFGSIPCNARTPISTVDKIAWTWIMNLGTLSWPKIYICTSKHLSNTSNNTPFTLSYSHNNLTTLTLWPSWTYVFHIFCSITFVMDITNYTLLWYGIRYGMVWYCYEFNVLYLMRQMSGKLSLLRPVPINKTKRYDCPYTEVHSSSKQHISVQTILSCQCRSGV